MINSDSLIGYILTGDFGLLTMTPKYLLLTLLPIITAFHIIYDFMEQTGKMARMAAKLDRPLKCIGLSAQVILPLALGLGCTTAALGAAQILNDRKERIITEAVLCIAVPCSAQFAVFVTLAFLLPLRYILLYFAVIAVIMILISLFLNNFIPHFTPSRTGFYAKEAIRSEFDATGNDPARNIKIIRLFHNAFLTALDFVKESTLPFIIGSVMVSILEYSGSIAWLCRTCAPFTSDFLHLPEAAANLFLLSIIKRDLGAASFLAIIENGSFSSAQLLTCLIMLTLFVPCFASIAVLFKAEKPPVTILIWLGSFVVSVFTGKFFSFLFGL